MTERIFIANENGDWWVHVPGDGLTWIRESDLLKIVKEEYGEDDLTGEDLDGIDKLERFIYEEGKDAEVNFYPYRQKPPACTCESKPCECEEEWIRNA